MIFWTYGNYLAQRRCLIHRCYCGYASILHVLSSLWYQIIFRERSWVQNCPWETASCDFEGGFLPLRAQSTWDATILYCSWRHKMWPSHAGFKDFIYLYEIECEKESEHERGERPREPSLGLDPGTQGSLPELHEASCLTVGATQMPSCWV